MTNTLQDKSLQRIRGIEKKSIENSLKNFKGLLEKRGIEMEGEKVEALFFYTSTLVDSLFDNWIESQKEEASHVN